MSLSNHELGIGRVTNLWRYAVKGLDRDELVKYLNDRKIGTRLLFGGNLLKQPYMLGRQYKTSGDIVNADVVMRDTFWIGVYPGLNEASLGYIIEVIESFVNSNGNV